MGSDKTIRRPAPVRNSSTVPRAASMSAVGAKAPESDMAGAKMARSAPIQAKAAVPERSGPPASVSGASSSMSIGPSREWVLPPRPKPGRKPNAETAAKRKAQSAAKAAAAASAAAKPNRKPAAREETVKEESRSETTVSSREKALEDEISQLKADNREMQASLALCQSRIDELCRAAEQRNSTGQTQLRSPASSPEHKVETGDMAEVKVVGASIPISVNSTHRRQRPTRMVAKREASWSSMDELATAAVKRSRGSESMWSHQSYSSQDFELTDSAAEVVVEDGCGFCTGDTLCVCRSATAAGTASAASASESASESRHDIEISRDSYFALPPIAKRHTSPVAPRKPEPLEPPQQVGSSRRPSREPGSCPQCQVDPLRRRFCTSLASELSDHRSHSAATIVTNSTSAKGMACDQVYQRLSAHERFGSKSMDEIVRELATGSQGMEIGVDKVENALRILDRGFGKDF